MSTPEAPSEVEKLFWAQAPVRVKPSVCKEGCRGGKIHRIRENKTVIVYCRGMACVTSPENIEIMKRENQGGSTD